MIDKVAPTAENSPKPTPPIEPTTPARKTTRWRKRYTLLIILVIVLALAGGSVLVALSVKEHVTNGSNHLQAALDSVKGDNVKLDSNLTNQVRQELVAAEADFEAARNSLGWLGPVPGLLGWVPKYGYDIAHLPTLLEMAQEGTQAGILVLDGVQPTLAVLTPSGGQDGASGKVLNAAKALNDPQAQQKFQQADSLISAIANQRATFDPNQLGIEQARKAVGQLDSQLPNLQDGIKLAQQLPPLLPDVLGQTRPVNYLLVIQNSDELRATGGFISAVGLMTFSGGKMTVSNFQDSYAVDANVQNPTPALAPLARYMNAGYLLLRDANWWPDFPTSARQLSQMYSQSQGVQPDGVIAIDIKAVSYVFQALGPVDIPDYNEHLTADNFEERLHYYFLPPGTQQDDAWWQKRKEFIGVAMKALIGKLNGASGGDYVRLLSELSQAAAQKHIQFYLANGELEKQLTQYKLDGTQTALAPSNNQNANDYLMLVESNVGFSKVNPKIDRTVDYRVHSPGNGANLFASLTVTYTNRAGVREGTQAGQCVKVTKYDSSYDAMIAGCYWNYLRIYAPPGSQLLNATGFPSDDPLTAGTENNKTVFASQVIIPPGGTLTLTVNYILPFQLASSGNYALTVQKQAGLAPIPYSVNLDLPQQQHTWQTNLDGDVVFDTKVAAGS